VRMSHIFEMSSLIFGSSALLMIKD
jgi:hypothetical protein